MRYIFVQISNAKSRFLNFIKCAISGTSSVLLTAASRYLIYLPITFSNFLHFADDITFFYDNYPK